MEWTSLVLSCSGMLCCVERENCLEGKEGVRMNVGLIKHGVKSLLEVRAAERTSSREADIVKGNYVKSGADSRPL